MTATKPLFPLLFLYCVSILASPAMAQPDCRTVEHIEAINEGVTQTAHIKGDNAILFIALDPIFSAPEYDYGDHYRDEHFTEAIKEDRESWVSAGIDEIVVWRFPNRFLGAAVPFKEGCVVSSYGEPDVHEKLMMMNEAFLEISKHGLNAPSVRDSIEKLLKNSRYEDMYKDEMIDIVINNLRPLMADTSSSDRTDNE